MVVKRGKEALLLWCKAHTRGYAGVAVTDFTTSWRDGLAFCALLHKFHPELIKYDDLARDKPKENLTLAFDVAEKLGIPRLLDVEEVAEAGEASMLAYVAKFYWTFKDRTGSRVNLKSSTKLKDSTGGAAAAAGGAAPREANASGEGGSRQGSGGEAMKSKLAGSGAVPPGVDTPTTRTRTPSNQPRSGQSSTKVKVGNKLYDTTEEYEVAVNEMLKKLRQEIIPAAEEQLAELFKERIRVIVDWESFVHRPLSADGLLSVVVNKDKETDGPEQAAARSAWQAIRVLYNDGGEVVFQRVVSVLEQFISGHPEVAKSIPTEAFNRIYITNIKASVGAGAEKAAAAQDRNSYIKDGEWVLRANFTLKKGDDDTAGTFSRNELLFILLDLFGILSKTEQASLEKEYVSAAATAAATAAAAAATAPASEEVGDAAASGEGDGAGKDEAAKEGPSEEEPAKEEPAKEEPAKEEPAKEEPAKEEPAKEEPAKEKEDPDKGESGKDEEAAPAAAPDASGEKAGEAGDKGKGTERRKSWRQTRTLKQISSRNLDVALKNGDEAQ